jgi:hypothetical protein
MVAKPTQFEQLKTADRLFHSIVGGASRQSSFAVMGSGNPIWLSRLMGLSKYSLKYNAVVYG